MTELEPALARVIATRSRGRMEAVAWAHSPEKNRAVVLLCARDSDYWLESLYERSERGWSEITTSNGTRSYGAGVYRIYGEAPEHADRVLVSWRGAIQETPVQNGYYAFAAWDVSDAEFESCDEPWVVGFVDASGRQLGEHP